MFLRVLFLSLLISETYTRSHEDPLLVRKRREIEERRKRRGEKQCPTLCVIDQTQGIILRKIDGVYQHELYIEKCNQACEDDCLFSQDPQTPQIMAHICAPPSEVCDSRLDPRCRRHVVVNLEQAILFQDLSSRAPTTEGPSLVPGSLTRAWADSEDSTTTPPSPFSTATTATSSSEFVYFSRGETTPAVRDHVTFLLEEGCSETAHTCSNKGEFCFGLVMVTGDTQYRCFPDKPDCSQVSGCIRVCLPQVESCHSTVSPSSSWGSDHPTTDEWDETVLPSTPGPGGKPTDQGYEFDNELDNETDDNEIEDAWDNEVESDANSGDVVTWSGITCSLIMHVVLVAMVI